MLVSIVLLSMQDISFADQDDPKDDVDDQRYEYETPNWLIEMTALAEEEESDEEEESSKEPWSPSIRSRKVKAKALEGEYAHSAGDPWPARRLHDGYTTATRLLRGCSMAAPCGGRIRRYTAHDHPAGDDESPGKEAAPDGAAGASFDVPTAAVSKTRSMLAKVRPRGAARNGW